VVEETSKEGDASNHGDNRNSDRNPIVRAKVSDFGTGCRMRIGQFSRRLFDQPLWLAPEVMLKLPYTEKVDVYAFGVCSIGY
jgi:hypothetical protein